MITTTKRNNYYQTDTVTPYNVWKTENGEWCICPARNCHLLVASSYRQVGGEDLVEGFKNKKSALAYIKTLPCGVPDWRGRDKVRTIQNSKINKNSYTERILKDSGYDEEYWDAYVRQMCEKVINWAHSTYVLRSTCNPEIKISFAGSWKARRSAAWGAWKVILRPYWFITKKSASDFFSFPEYSHINNDPDIGEYNSFDPHKTVLGIILHELAHSVDDGLNECVPIVKYHAPRTAKERHGHGFVWQTIYYDMRKKFLPEATGMDTDKGKRFI